jgi:hypothetical protein
MGFWSNLFGTSQPEIKKTITASAVDNRKIQEKLGHELITKIVQNINDKRFMTEKYGSTFIISPKCFKLPKDYDNTYFNFEDDVIKITSSRFRTDTARKKILEADIEIVADTNRVIRINCRDDESMDVKEKFKFDYNMDELIKLLHVLSLVDPEFTSDDTYYVNLETKMPKRDTWYTDGNGIYVIFDKSVHNRKFYNFDDWSMTDSDTVIDKVNNFEWQECEDPKKEHWEHFLRMDIAKKSKRANACIEYALSIFAKEKKYADIALTNGGNYFARIEDVETFNSFCSLVSETHYYQDYEIVNALAVIKQNKLLKPKK